MKTKKAVSLIGEAISEGGLDVWEYESKGVIISIHNGGDLAFYRVVVSQLSNKDKERLIKENQ